MREILVGGGIIVLHLILPYALGLGGWALFAFWTATPLVLAAVVHRLMGVKGRD